VAADRRLIEPGISASTNRAHRGSMPVKKNIELLLMPDAPLADRTCMVYRGTLVTGGQGSRSWSRPADSPKSG